MFHYYKTALHVVLILLPILIIGYKNHFDNEKKTALRFAFAVGVIWIYLLGVRFTVDTVDLWLAVTPEEIQMINDGDGAKNAFALVFGWVPGIILSALSWLLLRGWLWLKVCFSKLRRIFFAGHQS